MTPSQQQPPLERVRRYRALAIEDPNSGRNILEDVFNEKISPLQRFERPEEPPIPPDGGDVAIKSELLHLVQEKLNEDDTISDAVKEMVVDSKEDTPVVSSISDSLMVVPKQSPAEATPAAPRLPYKDGHWSPMNTSGKKIYDVELLMALRQDPKSLKKPEHIDRLDLIMSDTSPKQKFTAPRSGGLRSDTTISFANMRDDALFPDFSRSIPRNIMLDRKSQQGKSGQKGNSWLASSSGKPAVIHVSLFPREDIKLNKHSKGVSVERSTFNSNSLTESSKKILKIIADVQNDDIDSLMDKIKMHFKTDVQFTLQELILSGISSDRCRQMQLIGKVSGKLIVDQMLVVDEFVNILKQCIDKSIDVICKDDGIIDCLAKFIWSHRTLNNLTLWQVHTAFDKVIDQGKGYEFLLSLFVDKYKDCNENCIKELWEESPKMELIDWMSREKITQFLENLPLSFLKSKDEELVTPEAACSHLLHLMPQNENRDSINKWIKKNIDEAVKEGWFVRALTEAIYTYTLKPEENSEPRFDEAGSKRLGAYYPLLIAYVANQEKLELECLFAIQRVLNKLEHPHAITRQIFEHLWESGEVVSSNGFLAWESNADPKEQEGKGVMVVTLTSFFSLIKTTDDSSEGTTPSIADGDY
jgi:hypothetical protein